MMKLAMVIVMTSTLVTVIDDGQSNGDGNGNGYCNDVDDGSTMVIDDGDSNGDNSANGDDDVSDVDTD